MFEADEDPSADGTKSKLLVGKRSYTRDWTRTEADGGIQGALVVALKAEVDAAPAASSSAHTSGAGTWHRAKTQERIEKESQIKLAEIEAEKAKRSKAARKGRRAKRSTGVELTDRRERRMRSRMGAVSRARLQCADCPATTDHGLSMTLMATDAATDRGLVMGRVRGGREQRLGRPRSNGLLATPVRAGDELQPSQPIEAPVGSTLHPPGSRQTS